jgi:hypothetical protein
MNIYSYFSLEGEKEKERERKDDWIGLNCPSTYLKFIRKTRDRPLFIGTLLGEP